MVNDKKKLQPFIQKACEQKIFVSKGILASMMMGACSGQLYKYLAVFLFLFCLALVVYILICEYEKLAKITLQLRVILLQFENPPESIFRSVKNFFLNEVKI